MDDAERRRMILAALEGLDPEVEYALQHPTDYVGEYPQSGERFRGREAMRAMRRAYPAPPAHRVRRLRGAGDLWVAELTMDYGGRVYHAVSIQELRDGAIVRETDYFAEPFPAPAWRAPFVEPAAPDGPAVPGAAVATPLDGAGGD